MSEASGDLDPRLPPADAPVEWLGITLAVDFYPPIKITRKTGLEFTSKLAEILEPEKVYLEGKEWVISGGGVCEGIDFHIGERHLYFFVVPSSAHLERYEQRIETILRVFEQTFEPKAALTSNVAVTGLVALPDNTDARAFLGGYVMLMDPYRFGVIDRPLTILGVRLYFPACETVEWGVNVRIESWGQDPQKIYLNADAEWDQQTTWNAEFVSKLSARIATISTFISTQLIQFLREPPFPMKDAENNDDE